MPSAIRIAPTKYFAFIILYFFLGVSLKRRIHLEHVFGNNQIGPNILADITFESINRIIAHFPDIRADYIIFSFLPLANTI